MVMAQQVPVAPHFLKVPIDTNTCFGFRLADEDYIMIKKEITKF